MDVTTSPADRDPVVIAVKEPALAVSFELAVQALGLTARIHAPERDLVDLVLARHSTLIIDFDILPGAALSFLDQLRRRDWRGWAIVLTEGAASISVAPVDSLGLSLIEKPFVSSQLLSIVRQAHANRLWYAAIPK